VGTTSLVFGLILIGVALYIIFVVPTSSTSDALFDLLARLTLGIPMMVIGGLLLRKYDSDRKKEKISK